MEESTKNKNNKEIPYDIPIEGSLGLLALGAVGLTAWRKKREEYLKKQKEQAGSEKK